MPLVSGVVDTASNLPPVPLVLLISMAICHRHQQHQVQVAKFATGVVDTGGKFAIGVVDTGGNLPPVSLIPVEHLHLRISPRISVLVHHSSEGCNVAQKGSS
jgi:hypothetical protein